jgi:hypothetical protein
MKYIIHFVLFVVAGTLSTACTTDAMKARWKMKDPYRDQCKAYNDAFLADLNDNPRREDELFLDFSALVFKRCKEKPSIYCNPPRRPARLAELESTMGWPVTPDRCIQAEDGSFNWPN